MKRVRNFFFFFFSVCGFNAGSVTKHQASYTSAQARCLEQWKNTLQDKNTSPVTTTKSSAVLDANKMGNRTTRMMCVCKESDNKYFGLRKYL